MTDPVAQGFAEAVLRLALDSGAIREEAVLAMAEQFDRAGDSVVAHQLRCALIQAPSASYWQADRARARFRVVDGGNDGD